MPSYQDMEVRLKVLEDIIGWLVHSMQIEQVIPTGFSGPDGRPTAKVVKKRYIDLYREYKDANLAEVAKEAQRSKRNGARAGEVTLTIVPDPEPDTDTPATEVPKSGARDKSFAELRAELGLGRHLDD